MSLVKSLCPEIKTRSGFSASLNDKFTSFTAPFLGAALIALSAQVSIPLPTTPVPLCLSAQVVCWLAWNFPAVAPRAVAIYLLGACLKLPVLAMASTGWLVLLGPRAGYLFGYFIAALAVSRFRCSAHCKQGWQSALLSQWLGSLLILSFGMGRLAFIIGIKKAFQMGLFPFLLTDLVIKAPFLAAFNSSKSEN